MDFYSIGGFFGSGKTTLLLLLAKHLSQRCGLQVAIIQNEIGRVGVDDLVARSAGLNTTEILGGCICCEMRNGLVSTLQHVSRKVKPDAIVLEASGMAMPNALAQVLDDANLSFARAWKTVVLDAARLRRVENCLQVPYVEHVVDSADAVIYNKMDLVDPARYDAFQSSAKARRNDLVVIPATLNRLSEMPESWKLLFESVPFRPLPAENGSTHDHSHHATKPAVCVAQGIYGTHGRSDPESLADCVARLGSSVRDQGTTLIGHLKLYAEYDEGSCLIRLADAGDTVSIDVAGTCSGEPARLTLNAIVFGLSQDALRRIVDSTLPIK